MPYPYEVEIPVSVLRAQEQAVKLGFPMLPEGRPIGHPAPTTAITPMDGALLRCLASRGGNILEIGTGPGVSTAWILDGMPTDARLLTCEIEGPLAASASEYFSSDGRVEVRSGDWQTVIEGDSEFDLIFFDGAARLFFEDHSNWDPLVDMMKLRGQLILDDLAPIGLWPSEWKGMTDHQREFVLCNPRIAGVEVMTSVRTACVVGTRIA